MPFQRISLVASPTNRGTNPDASATKDQRFTNCYAQITKNAITGKGNAVLIKRPGFSAANLADATYQGGSGSILWTGSGSVGVFCFRESGNTLQVWRTSGTQVGTSISNITGSMMLNETTLSGIATLTLVATKSTTGRRHMWFYSVGDVAWTEVTDADFPSNQATPIDVVGNVVHMDGYAFIIDVKGNIWNSDLNSLANWTITSFVNAQSFPDVGAGLARLKNYIVAFGLQSTEVFQNGGNATGSPLTRIPSAATRIGSFRVAANNNEVIKEIGDSVYFFGIEQDSGRIGFYQMNGTAPQKISNAAIDNLMAQYASSNQYGIAGAMQLNGMMHVILYNGAGTEIPAYCVDTGQWWYIDTGNSVVIEACLGFQSNTWFVTRTNGASEGRKLFTANANSPTYQDNSVAFTMTAQLQELDFGTRKRKFFTSLELVGDIRSTSGNTAVSWSDDDYVTYSTPTNIDMSVTPPSRPRITRLGSSRRRSFKITDAVNAPLRLEAIDLEFEMAAI